MSEEKDKAWETVENKILNDIQKAHLKLMKWLNDNHPDILMQYCDEELNGLKIGFLKVEE